MNNQVSHQLTVAYAKICFQKLQENIQIHSPRPKFRLSQKDLQFINRIVPLTSSLQKYKDPQNLDQALDAIDLASIYAGVEKREEEAKDNNGKLVYEDYVVLEVLHYFKNSFFKWITKPECPMCHKDDKVEFKGTAMAPVHNPDEITRIEVFRCFACNIDVSFPRYNNPVKLLETRLGRCGEWVNCFLLILQALLGSEAQIRYVWNYEDHVWAEYFSKGLDKWVHLDPCEGLFDEPNLYCDNWGKSMSWVLGINNSYMIDLTDKYVTNPDKRIPLTNIVDNVSNVRNVIKVLGYKMMLGYFVSLIDPIFKGDEKWDKFYEVLVMYFKERRLLTLENTTSGATKTSTKGRQTGGAEWTEARGESG